MRVALVTGTRQKLSYDERCFVHLALSRFDPRLVIHGACGIDAGNDYPGDWPLAKMKGADAAAQEYCLLYNEHCEPIPVPANWTILGKGAGPSRNRDMSIMLNMLRKAGYECKVLAFPKGSSPGTCGMIKLARAAAFQVEIHEL